MIRLLPDEIAACRRDQFERVCGDYVWRSDPRCQISGSLRRNKTRYHLLLRPLATGRLRLVLAATRSIGGEVRGVAEWLVGEPSWRINPTFDFWGLAGWLVKWDQDPRRRKDVDVRLGRIGGKDAIAPLWPWAPLANDAACLDTPWEWIARAARMVDEKHLPRYFASARLDPRTELLARAGMDPAWFRPNALRRLREDPELLRFVSQNAERIAAEELLPRDLLYGRKRGWEFERTARHAELRRAWHGCPTYGVPLDAADRYLQLTRHNGCHCAPLAVGRLVSRREYSEYCENAKLAGLDLSRREVAFPEDFDRAFAEAERAYELKRIENARARDPFPITARLTAEERERIRQRIAEEHARRRAEQIERKKLMRELPKRLRTAATFAAAALKRLPLPDGWRVRPIRTVAEFRAEGRRMHNCIGGGAYAEKVAKGLAICFVLEGPDKETRHDLELALGPSPRVVQLYGVCNRPPLDVAREVALRIAGAIRKAREKIDRKKEKKERKTA